MCTVYIAGQEFDAHNKQINFCKKNFSSVKFSLSLISVNQVTRLFLGTLMTRHG